MPLQCLSNRCRARCLTKQCQAHAHPCRAPRHNALTSLCITLQFFHSALAVRIVAVPIRAVPSRCCPNHGAVLCPRHSYPLNSMPSQVQPYQCPAVAPADHCVTVRARPSHCRSDHLMAPAFRLISGPGCALADLSRVLLYICSPMQIEAVAQRPVSKLPSPMPSHRPASRFAAVRISAFRQHCHRYPHQRDTQLRTSNAPFTSALAIIANLSNAISLPFKSTQRPRQS